MRRPSPLSFLVALLVLAARDARAAGPVRRAEPAPLVDILQAEVRVPASLGENRSELAKQMALKDAVDQALKSDHPDPTRLKVYETRILPRYNDFVFSSRLLESRTEGDVLVARYEVYVLRDRLDGERLAQGLKKTGEHLEMRLLYSQLSGGSEGSSPLPAGAVMTNHSYSGTMLGFAARYYFTDAIFGEGSALLLSNPVVVGTYTSPAGQRYDLKVTQYAPFAFLAGYKWLDARGFKVTTSAGLSATSIRWRTDAPGLGNTNDKDHQFVTSYVLGGGLQWQPTRWVGLGLQARYSTRTHFDAITEKTARRWALVPSIDFTF